MLESLRGQVTVLLSSHILADVERICDTIGIIRKGELVLVSRRDELLESYAANAVILEFDPASLPIPAAFLRALAGTALDKRHEPGGEQAAGRGRCQRREQTIFARSGRRTGSETSIAMNGSAPLWKRSL